MDKTDSSKFRSFCFVEFHTHAQASVAHALYHCTSAATSSRTAAYTTPHQQINDCCEEKWAAQDPGFNSGQKRSSTHAATRGSVQLAAAKRATSASSAVSSLQDGANLKVDWADPLRYHIHLHESIKGPHDAAGEHCSLRGSGVSKAGDRVQNSQSQQRPRQQQRAHHHTSHHPPACQQRSAAVQHRPRDSHVFRHQHPRLPPLPSASSSFLDSNTLSSSSSSLPTYHQLAYYDEQQEQQQLPPIHTSSTDPNRLCVNQLKRLQQQLQAEHDDDMARYGFTTDLMHWNSPLPAVAWASRSTADINGSGSFYFDGQLSHVSLQRWQQQDLYPLPGGKSGSDSCYLGNDDYWYVPQSYY
jgi:hypothetical protein